MHPDDQPPYSPAHIARLIALAALLAVLALALLAGRALADDRLAATAAAKPESFNVHTYTPTIFDVHATSYAPLTRFISDAGYQPFQAMMDAVPKPSYFSPSAGLDGESLILDHGRDQTVELFKARVDATDGKWHARWGGRAPNSSFAPNAWGRTWDTSTAAFGVQASGFAFTPGVIRVKDLQAGRIPHALHLLVPYSCKTFVAPATRTDAAAKDDGTWDCYRYGTAWKLPQSWVIPAGAKRVVRLMMQAAKDYGVVATDATAYGLGFRLENWKRKWAPWGGGETMTDPYRDATEGPGKLNLFECPAGVTPPPYSCYGDENNMLKVLTTYKDPATGKSFWQALEQVNPAP